MYLTFQICWGHVPSIHYCCLSSLLQIVVLNAWHLGPGWHDFRSELIMFSWIYLCSWCYLQFVCTYYSPKPVTSRWQVGVSMGKDYDLRSTCIHGVIMLWSGALWKEYLNCQKFLNWPRRKWAGRTKDVVQVLVASTQLPWDTCLMFDLHLDAYFLSVCHAPWINLSIPCSARPPSPSL